MGLKSTLPLCHVISTWLRSWCYAGVTAPRTNRALHILYSWPTKTIHVVNLCNSLAEWKHAMIVSHYMNINLNAYIMPHTVIKSRYTNVKNHSEISRYFSVHVLPCPLRNSKELAKFYHFKLPWRLPNIHMPAVWRTYIIMCMFTCGWL